MDIELKKEQVEIPGAIKQGVLIIQFVHRKISYDV